MVEYMFNKLIIAKYYMEPRQIFWKTKKIIPGTTWTLSGYSRSRYRSGFFISGINIMFDGGPQLFVKPEHVLITHTHGDHIAELPFTLIHKPSKEEDKITVYRPEEATQYLHDYIIQLHKTNSMREIESKSNEYYNMVQIQQKKSELRIKINNQNILLETVGAFHSIPTVVYGITLIKEKLDPQYSSLSGKELCALKKSGQKITIEVFDKKICYVLDTSIEILEKHDFLLEYHVILIECTFLLDDEIEMAIKKKHIHWMQLKPYVEKYRNNTFILTHFSLRYKDSEIKDFFDKVKKQDNINNIIPWLTDTI